MIDAALFDCVFAVELLVGAFVTVAGLLWRFKVRLLCVFASNIEERLNWVLIVAAELFCGLVAA